MLCSVIEGPTFQEALNQIESANGRATYFEFRLDLWDNLHRVKELKKRAKGRVIFTLRSREQGGSWIGCESDRLHTIRALAKLQPDYIDLEYHVEKGFVDCLVADFPSIQIIISFHDFQKTPANLHEILENIRSFKATIYKMACFANCTTDSLRMLDLVRLNPSLIGLCLGEHGQISRLLSPSLGAPWTYCHSQPKEGQISFDSLDELYFGDLLFTRCAFFALIGDTGHSRSHQIHNSLFRKLSLNALYFKMQVVPDELSTFVFLAKRIGFKGFSVTMPLKEAIIPYLDRLGAGAEAMGAVNTLVLENDQWVGYNTDARGALDALEKKIPVKDKQIALFGAGGAARAIIYEALRRGARVQLYNRSKQRAQRVAHWFGIPYHLTHEIEGVCDILINATGSDLPIEVQKLASDCLVMDITVRPIKTKLLEEAEKRGCSIVCGYEMFIYQALGQYRLWFEVSDHEPWTDLVRSSTIALLQRI